MLFPSSVGKCMNHIIAMNFPFAPIFVGNALASYISGESLLHAQAFEVCNHEATPISKI